MPTTSPIPPRPIHFHSIPTSRNDPFFGIEQILFNSYPNLYQISSNPPLHQCLVFLNIIKHIFLSLNEDQKYELSKKLFEEETKLRDELSLDELQEDLRKIIDKLKNRPSLEGIVTKIKMIESYLFPDIENVNLEEKAAFDGKIEELTKENLSSPEKETISRGLDTILRLFEEKKSLLPIEIHNELNMAIGRVKSLVVNKRNGRNP